MLPVLLIAGITDLRYRKIPNCVILMIFGWALLFCGACHFERFAGTLAVALPLFILALTTGKIKGGDYKFLVACAFALGLYAFIKSLFFTVIVAVIQSLIKHEKNVPLAFVFLVGYVIFLLF